MCEEGGGGGETNYINATLSSLEWFYIQMSSGKVNYTNTTMSPQTDFALRWAVVVLLFHYLLGVLKSQDNVHEEQLLKRKTMIKNNSRKRTIN